ncbi:MAG: putative aminohydrolase SsnA [Chloroflexota bacterium]
MSLLLTGGAVVTSLDPVAVEVADVLIGGGHIVAAGAPSQEEHAERAIKECIDASGCLVIPGNVNAHMHLYSALARGMPYAVEPPLNFLQILQRVWWRLDRALDEESIRASALVGGMEALLSGTTTLIDHHASPDAIDGSLDVVAEALGSLGLRSVCAYEVSDRDGPERAGAGLDESARFLGAVADGAFPLARGMVGAHASFTLSSETLEACVALADEHEVGIHIHAAEDVVDEIDSQRRYGLRVAERLADAGALTDATLLAHGVQLDDEEVRLVKASGATLAHNPRSNMNNSVGRTPLSRLGDRVALGTDGIGSDMFAESQAAFFRLRDDGAAPAPDWPLARLTRGAEFAGRAFAEPALGRIETGAPADLVILDYGAPTPVDASTLAGHWLYGLASRHVRDVIVAGQVVVRERRLALVDQEALVAEARDQASRLWQRLDSIDSHPFDPQEV